MKRRIQVQWENDESNKAAIFVIGFKCCCECAAGRYGVFTMLLVPVRCILIFSRISWNVKRGESTY